MKALSLAAPSGSAERPTTIAYEMYANVRHQCDLRLAELEQAKTDRNKAAKPQCWNGGNTCRRFAG